MSRVERIDKPSERRGTEPRQTERGRTANRRTDSPGHTPGKAEGEDHTSIPTDLISSSAFDFVTTPSRIR